MRRLSHTNIKDWGLGSLHNKPLAAARFTRGTATRPSWPPTSAYVGRGVCVSCFLLSVCVCVCARVLVIVRVCRMYRVNGGRGREGGRGDVCERESARGDIQI